MGGADRAFASIDEVLAFDFDEWLNPLVEGCKKCDAPNARLQPVGPGEWSVFDADSTRVALALMRALYLDGAPEAAAVRGSVSDGVEADPFGPLRWNIEPQAGQRALIGDRCDPCIGKFELVAERESSATDGRPLVLRGDTLITYRAMVAAVLGRRSPDDLDSDERAALESILDDGGAPILGFCERHGRLANDHRLHSLFLLPYRPGFALNGPRGIGASYKDNPFAFFEALRQAYCCPDDAERACWAGEGDAVCRGIVGTWAFWGLFGQGDDGFRAFLDRFCLAPVLDEAFDEFRAPDLLASVRELEHVGRLGFLERYVRALHGLGLRRQALLRRRLEAVGVGRGGA